MNAAYNCRQRPAVAKLRSILLPHFCRDCLTAKTLISPNFECPQLVEVLDTATLGTRHPDSVPWEIDDRIIPYLERTRLYDFHLIAYGRVDRAIITAHVERWRQETHTFHLPLGEATITLLDVALLTRLPIEGRVVTTAGRQLSS